MNKDKRIINNPSTVEMLKQLKAFESLKALFEALPFVRKLFPKLEDMFKKFSEINKQSELLSIPDKFNDIFSESGWIAYESMNIEVMKEAVSLAESEGFERAEIFLSEHYNEETLKLVF